ncbi:MAG: type III pantothenate kinase, partial [Robiginitomaculum sp.]|nr:type III pantothenate kinase [Robiginitomaculum sp.]
ARRYLNCEPLIVGEDGVDLSVIASTDNPKEVGADRLVNAVGARTLVDGALLLVDSGTATTFDVVTDDDRFIGGAIAAGMYLSLEALHDAAAKLPRIALQKPKKAIGANTVNAMQTGIFWGHVEMIDGLVRRIKNEYGKPMTVIGTGGVSPLFDGASKEIERFESDLTIRGLLEIYRQNVGA